MQQLVGGLLQHIGTYFLAIAAKSSVNKLVPSAYRLRGQWTPPQNAATKVPIVQLAYNSAAY